MTDEELTFYEVAYHLHIPLYQLLREMTYQELLGWIAYFEKRPVGWREDERVYKLLQTQGVKAKPGDIFPSLKAVTESVITNNDGQVDGNKFKKSFMFQKLLSAKHGDQVLL